MRAHSFLVVLCHYGRALVITYRAKQLLLCTLTDTLINSGGPEDIIRVGQPLLPLFDQFSPISRGNVMGARLFEQECLFSTIQYAQDVTFRYEILLKYFTGTLLHWFTYHGIKARKPFYEE